ncbi:MAG: type II toxin-antitoxin system VapC family toxin [Anaerolineales bacterium]|nr:type II toxin-antitoxin system VapC family toxin [Anaerolineales bacterium]
MSKPVSEFTGEALYVDTMIPYVLLRAIEPSAKHFFDRIQNGEFIAYTSVLTFDELAYRMLLALIRDNYGGSPLNTLRTLDKKVITEFYSQIAPQLTYMQDFFYLGGCDYLRLKNMNQAILQYQLLPRDALHYSAMKKIGCYDLICHDADFDQVDKISRYTLPT